MKILGLMMTYNNLHFFKCALKQAINFCDEVIIVEGSHLKDSPQRSKDGTCEYIETIKNNPKIIVKDFKVTGTKYNILQCALREKFVKESLLWEPGNWVLQWDDDWMFFDEDLPKVNHILETADKDTIMFRERRFAYNFKLSLLAPKSSVAGIRMQRITDGCYYTPVSHLHYKDGINYTKKADRVLNYTDIIYHHYPYVKTSDRVKFRWDLSVNKGTKSNKNTYELWKNMDLKKDIFKQEKEFRKIIGGIGNLEIYIGEHPEVLDNHPWRYIDDVRNI